VGKRYLWLAGSEEYFLKIGTDSPENLLAYDDFDNTPNHLDLRKQYKNHTKDWRNVRNPRWCQMASPIRFRATPLGPMGRERG